MNHDPSPKKILLMNVDVHAILYLALSFQLCGFDATNPHYNKKPSHNVLGQRCHMPASGAHVLGLAC